eukprot:gnl/TRDRNA2_/TRDRNA2_151311_c1_seq1.p1 gnl/TRDRNA2_/TRDRNA2_151311_c1~~gnl/TRDRNA2_/TRDRNA2_151311_c1_seq1.p1  ORF type:complete len:618 (+),score=104.21 gnl/TRDRNA2_/TRDRNA2_151311_c1_seq1:191-2044(+)
MISVLRDPQLSVSQTAVRAALYCIASKYDNRRDNLEQIDIPWCERREIAEAALGAISRFDTDEEVMSNGFRVIGVMLHARAPDAEHEQTEEAAVTRALVALQAQRAKEAPLRAAAAALAHLVEGNARAIGILQYHREEAVMLVKHTMAAQEDKKTLKSLAEVLYAIQGTPGLLEGLSCELLRGCCQQAALLAILGERAEDCDLEALVQLRAVDAIRNAMQAPNVPAPAGIAAMGRVVEFLLQHAGQGITTEHASVVQEALRLGVDVIVARLQHEVASSKPDVFVYGEALGALRNASRRSAELAQRIAAYDALTTAVNLAFEKDYFNLDFVSLLKLLGAVSFFSGLSRLQEMLEKYPEAPVFHEAACGVLVDDAEHEDGLGKPGSVLHSAASLSFYGVKVLTVMVPQAHTNREALSIRAVRLLGLILGEVAPGTFLPIQQKRLQQQDQPMVRPEFSDPEGPVLEDGIRSLVGVLRRFPASSKLASEVCSSLVKIAASSSGGILQILQECGVRDALLELMSRFRGSTKVMAEAVVALGVLGGVDMVIQLMDAWPEMYSVQLSGCHAIVEMHRMSLLSLAPVQREAVERTIGRAQDTFRSTFSARPLQEKAALALGICSL